MPMTAAYIPKLDGKKNWIAQWVADDFPTVPKKCKSDLSLGHSNDSLVGSYHQFMVELYS